jgi:hypothetical protein
MQSLKLFTILIERLEEMGIRNNEVLANEVLYS